MKNDTVLRHSLIVRIIHWLVALSGLALVFTGMGELPMYKRYGVTAIPGLTWSGDFILNLKLHYIFAGLFMTAVFFHMTFHLRRREFAAFPKKGDLSESIEIIKCMVMKHKEPPHEKFLAEQRLAYFAIGIASLALIVTGIVKTYKNLGVITLDPIFLQAITLTHTALTLLFMVLIVAHLAAFLIKANWPLLPSILTGKVKRSYATERHPRWKYDREC